MMLFVVISSSIDQLVNEEKKDVWVDVMVKNRAINYLKVSLLLTHPEEYLGHIGSPEIE